MWWFNSTRIFFLCKEGLLKKMNVNNEAPPALQGPDHGPNNVMALNNVIEQLHWLAWYRNVFLIGILLFLLFQAVLFSAFCFGLVDSVQVFARIGLEFINGAISVFNTFDLMRKECLATEGCVWSERSASIIKKATEGIGGKIKNDL